VQRIKSRRRRLYHSENLTALCGAAAEGGERYDADRKFKRGVQPPRRHRYFAMELSVTQARAWIRAETEEAAGTRARAAAARRETADLEKARLIEQLRHSNLRMQAQSEEIETLGRETPQSLNHQPASTFGRAEPVEH
jgi:hypothetical protein